MKTTALFIVAIVVLAAFSSCTSKNGPSSSKTDTLIVASSESYYTCPMHPFVRSDHPGACPVCGMALVKKSGAENLTANQLKLLEDVSLSPTQMVLANVRTAVVRRQTLDKEISSVGVVSVAEPLQATIAARFRGRVGKIYANYTGFTVNKGEPLFELYSPDIISAVQDYLLALEGTRSSSSASGPQGPEVQGQLLAAAKARLENHFGMTAQQIGQIEKTRQIPSLIRFDSPIRGTVLVKNVQEGQYVDEGTVLYQLGDLSKVWMYLDVYEQNMRHVKIGQDVTVTTDAFPGEVSHGRVTFIDATVNSETRTVRVRTEFQNPGLNLKPNMYVVARIKTPVENAIVIPNSAIVQTGKRSVVWVEAKPNTFEPRNVVVGASTDDQSEIVQGLQEGDVVAASGGFLIDSESQLNESSSTPAPQHAGMNMGGQQSVNDPMARPSQSMDESMQMDSTKAKKENKAQASRSRKSTKQSPAVQDVTIVVRGSYSPDEIHTVVGKKLRLHFFRDEESPCTAEVVFDKLDIRQFLPPRDTTVVEITTTKRGTIDFHCGMGMVKGKIIVD